MLNPSIAIVLSRFEDRAHTRLIWAITEAIVGGGGKVHILTEAGLHVKPLRNLGAIFHEISFRSLHPLQLMSDAKRLVNFVAVHNIDLLHTFGSKACWVAKFAKRNFTVPVITHFDGNPPMRSIQQRIVSSAQYCGDLVSAGSYYSVEQLSQRKKNAISRARVVYTSVDINNFKARDVTLSRQRELLSFWEMAPKEGMKRFVLSLPKFGTSGNVINLILAIAGLPDGILNKTLFILAVDGGPTDQSRLDLAREVILQNGLEDQVKLVDRCPDLAAAFSMSQLFIGSPTQNGNLSVREIEACAMGLPTIAVGDGATSELILIKNEVGEGRYTGWRAQQDDPIALKDVIKTVLEIPTAEKAGVADRAHLHVSKYFTQARLQSQIRELYAELL